ncbi:unnamed protein product [Phytophthora fragariaefolia]|uniref:Unnamed protein product n=1 Tax=Phytophthora fragariaefolia TaxID=1490495 RepID=A0A9W7CZW9_9STRA|nr:unnamed protein product [Phytophthora fragariaefolia]
MSSAPLWKNPTRPQQAAPREGQNSVGRSKGRNFEAEEEVMICKAYLHIGKDAGTGTGQAAAKFWSRVAEYYNEQRPDGADRRRLRSLETKLAVIQHDLSKFCGCMANPRCSLMCVWCSISVAVGSRRYSDPNLCSTAAVKRWNDSSAVLSPSLTYASVASAASP